MDSILQITEQDLLLAMAECDHYEIFRFRKLYGNKYREARNLYVYRDYDTPMERGPYEARPLVAAAWAHHVRDRNFHVNFNYGNIHDHMPNNTAHDFLTEYFQFSQVVNN